MNDRMSELLIQFERQEGATPVEIAQAERELSISFPTDYIELISATNGGHGFVGEEYFMLYELNSLIMYEEFLEQFPTGVQVIGGNGGGEAYCIATGIERIYYFVVPYIGDGRDDVIVLGYSMEEFLETLFVGDIF